MDLDRAFPTWVLDIVSLKFKGFDYYEKVVEQSKNLTYLNLKQKPCWNLDDKPRNEKVLLSFLLTTLLWLNFKLIRSRFRYFSTINAFHFRFQNKNQDDQSIVQEKLLEWFHFEMGENICTAQIKINRWRKRRCRGVSNENERKWIFICSLFSTDKERNVQLFRDNVSY